MSTLPKTCYNIYITTKTKLKMTQIDISDFNKALRGARQMQNNWLQYGVNFVDLEGDWLQEWDFDFILF